VRLTFQNGPKVSINPTTAYRGVMPEVPDPPFPSGEPYWYWLGGRPALDFVNTRRERWNRRIECLVDDADLVGWLVAAGLLDATPTMSRDLVESARELREAIDAGVRAAVAGAPAPAPALAVIDWWLVHAARRARLGVGPDGMPHLDERPPAASPRAALGAVALDAARMLGVPNERARVRICAAASCSARFYDRSAAAGRRWCSMAMCGNAEKARRFRERRAGAAS
jgi:predicted RNA-binding Zn ribbon-like protein